MRRALVFIFLFGGLQASAQIDTLFWLAPPEFSSGSGEAPVKLFVSAYADTASVTVTQPANGGFTPIQFEVPANETDSIDLSSFLGALETEPSDNVLSTGLRIASSHPVSASYQLLNDSSRSSFSLKGQNGVGDEFYIPMQNEWGNGSASPQPYSSFDIVATEDNTTLLISPLEDLVGHPGGTSYQVDLDEGETYSAEDVDPDPVPSIAGSIVSSDNSFAISIKDDHLIEDSCSDPIGEQLVPVDRIGQEYVVHNTPADSERVFVLTTENGTTIEVEDGSGTTSQWLNGRETYQVPIDSPLTHITANKPVYALHVAGSGCQKDAAVLPPKPCAGSQTLAFHRRSSDTLGLALTVRSGAEGNFELDGDPSLITAADFSPVPGTGGNYVGATLSFGDLSSLGLGHHVVENDTDIFRMEVFHGDPEKGFHYRQRSSFDASTVVDAGSDTTICANRTLQLDGRIEGGANSGLWTTNGSGSFSDPNDLNGSYEFSLSDELDGQIEIVLTSTGPCESKSDTMEVTITPDPEVNAGNDISVCANGDGAELNGSVAEGATTGQWSSSGSGSFVPDVDSLDATYMPSPADTSSGSVTLTLSSTNNGGCLEESDSLELTITPAPNVEAGPDTTLCANIPSLQLDGNISGGSTQGVWTSSGSGLFNPSPNNLDPDYYPSDADTANGSVRLYLTSTNNGDCQEVQDSLEISFTEAPKVDAGPDDALCENEGMASFQGSVSGATNTGVWTGGNGVFDPSDTTFQGEYGPTPSEASSGSVTLTLTSTNNGGCLPESDSMTVRIEDSPNAQFSVPDDCAEEGIFFTNNSQSAGSGALSSFDWDFGDGDSSFVQSPTHAYPSGGQYEPRLIVTASNGCSDTVEGSVTVHPLPEAAFDYDGICMDNGIRVEYEDISSGNGDSISSWSWTLGDGTSAIIQDPSHVYPNTDDRVTSLEVTTDKGCKDTVQDSVILQDPPDAGFGVEARTRKVGSVIQMRDSSNRTVTYEWDFGDGSLPESGAEPEHIYDAAGTYRIVQIVRNAIGCPDTATRKVTIDGELVEIPNAISPNGDGKNDSWKLRFLEIYPDAEVRIHDRWGKEVFYSRGYSEEWDGTLNGEPLPEGTYYYVIELGEGDRGPLKGPIILAR